ASHLVFELAEHVFVDVNRHLRRDRDRDRVAGTAIDLDDFAVLADAQLGVIGVVHEFADEDVLKFGPEHFDRGGDEIMGQRPRRWVALDAAVDAGGLEDADYDREAALPLDLAQHDDLLVVNVADDD